MNLTFEIWALTDTGKIRDHNEDNFVVAENLASQNWVVNSGQSLSLGTLGTLMVVADGMGGTNAGEIASEIAVQEVKQQFSQLEVLPADIPKYLKEVILLAHKAILAHTENHPNTRGMGTTLILGWVINGFLYVGWSGDSRCYLYRKGIELRPLTDDHSLVWEMVKNNILTPEQARLHPDSNIITQSLGNSREAPKPETLREPIPLQVGDRLLLCSDGLNAMLSDPQIESYLTQSSGVKDTCHTLVEAANLAGGYDNITVLLLDVKTIKAAPVVVVNAEETLSEATQTHTLEPLPPQQEERSSFFSKNSLFWLIGGIFLFGSLIAAIFWAGNQLNDTPQSAEIPQGNIEQSIVDSESGSPTETELSSGITSSQNLTSNSRMHAEGIRSDSSDNGQTENSDSSDNSESGASRQNLQAEAGSVLQVQQTRFVPSPTLQEVQDKVNQIIDKKYHLIRFDRLEILKYRYLSQKQKKDLTYIQHRLAFQHPNSIFQELTQLVELSGKNQQVVKRIIATEDPQLTAKLDKLIAELDRFELIVRQMEQ